MQIDLLFPTPVYCIVDDKDYCDRARLRRACLAITKDRKILARKNPYHRVDTSYQLNDRLHQNEKFTYLETYIRKNAKKFLTALGFPDRPFKITRMWTNVGSKGDFVYPHTHIGEAFVSGVYYISCDKRDGINIHDPVDRMPPQELNSLNTSSYFYEGMEGRLLMFRAETMHSTFPQEGDERIIVSFNLQLENEDD